MFSHQTIIHSGDRLVAVRGETLVSRFASPLWVNYVESGRVALGTSDRRQGDMAVLLQQRKRAIVGQLGIAPETLSRVLRHLRERSLISGSGRVLNLVDPTGLRSLAGV
jgi:hypothetical protein